MKFKEVKKLIAILVASGALAVSLSACGGDRDTSPEPTPPNSPGIEQPLNENKVDSIDSIPIVALPEVDSQINISQEMIQEIDRIYTLFDPVHGEELAQVAIDFGVPFIAQDKSFVEVQNMESDGLIESWRIVLGLAVADFEVNGKLSSSIWVDLQPTDEHKEVMQLILNICNNAQSEEDFLELIELTRRISTLEPKSIFNYLSHLLIRSAVINGIDNVSDASLDKLMDINEVYQDNIFSSPTR